MGVIRKILSKAAGCAYAVMAHYRANHVLKLLRNHQQRACGRTLRRYVSQGHGILIATILSVRLGTRVPKPLNGQPYRPHFIGADVEAIRASSPEGAAIVLAFRFASAILNKDYEMAKVLYDSEGELVQVGMIAVLGTSILDLEGRFNGVTST
jgi:hypothetical protein